MNFLFISPHFPPQFLQFCKALREKGICVLAVGDVHESQLTHSLRAVLNEYVFVPQLESYEEAYRAVAGLISRHGRIDRVDSHNEHWLELESRLRDDFRIPGPGHAQMALWRSKSSMASLFKKAGVLYPESVTVESWDKALKFAKHKGYPLVIKPDVGVGATRTFKILKESELREAFAHSLDGYILQPFIEGTMGSYDGLVDARGRVVADFAHVYSSGVMEVVNQRLDMSYWTRREIPESLRENGRRIVEVFGITERFFHIEFFERPNGTYCALEVNVRPPGGFTTDMMNYSADIDIYRLWAQMIAGDNVEAFSLQRKFHVAHVSRRKDKPYRFSYEDIQRELTERLLFHCHLPEAWATAMGDEAFLIRAQDFAELKQDMLFIQA